MIDRQLSPIKFEAVEMFFPYVNRILKNWNLLDVA